MRITAVEVQTLTRNWQAVLLRGVAALLFGILTLFAPGVSLAALVLLFGAYALVDGVLAIVSAIRRRDTSERWGMLLLEGVVGIAAGVVTLVWPGVTAVMLVLVIGAWAVVTGVLEILAAIRLRKAITGEWLLALSGILSLVFGLMLMAMPGAGALALILWIGAYAVVFGSLFVALAFRLRSWERHGIPESAARTA